MGHLQLDIAQEYNRNGAVFTCSQPASSVLFDGTVPTLISLDGDLWASQLLTLQKTTPIDLTFDVTDIPGYNVGVDGRVEVVHVQLSTVGDSSGGSREYIICLGVAPSVAAGHVGVAPSVTVSSWLQDMWFAGGACVMAAGFQHVCS